MKLGLATEEDLDAGLDAIRVWFCRALFFQTLCIFGLLVTITLIVR